MTACKNIIYGLVDPRSGLIRYVGKSTKGLSRAREHIHQVSREKTYKAAWIRKLLRLGLNYGIKILEACSTPEELSGVEKKWIAKLRNDGFSLTNLTDGGEGMCGYCPSPEARKKISERSKGNRYAAGHIRTKEHRQKLAEANKGNQHWKGRVHSEETKAKLRAKHIGKTMSKEACLKMSMAQEQLWQDPLHRKKMSGAHLGHKRSAESVEKTRMGNLGQKRSSEARARMSRSQRLRRERESCDACS